MNDFEWKRRMEFAEFAEAIGIRTDSIMAAMPDDGDRWRVMFTRDEDTDNVRDESPIYMVNLARTEHGILATVEAPRQISTFGEFQKRIERMMD